MFYITCEIISFLDINLFQDLDGRIELLDSVDNRDTFLKYWFKNTNYKENTGYRGKYSSGTRRTRNGLFHSWNDNPALCAETIKTWRKFGILHRGNDLPAIIFCGGEEWWWKGELHREGGLPAMKYIEGEQYWVSGKLHREGGPAVSEPANGYEAWWWKGKLHREGGPAVESDDGNQWWLHGVKQSRESYYSNGLCAS